MIKATTAFKATQATPLEIKEQKQNSPFRTFIGGAATALGSSLGAYATQKYILGEDVSKKELGRSLKKSSAFADVLETFNKQKATLGKVGETINSFIENNNLGKLAQKIKNNRLTRRLIGAAVLGTAIYTTAVTLFGKKEETNYNVSVKDSSYPVEQ